MSLVASVTPRKSTKPPRALSLDLDETLLDGSGDSIINIYAMLAEALPELELERIRQGHVGAWETYWPEVEHAWELGLVAGASVTLEAWRRTLRNCGCGDESLAKLAADTHRQLIRESHRLFDDAQAFVESARTAGIPLALVTNGASDTQREKLEVLGIEHWFEMIVISGEVGVAKPDPSVFAIALASLGIDAEDTWHVGDSLTKDVVGAAASGMTAVWLNRKGTHRPPDAPEPDVEVCSLSDLAALIEHE